jgi:hypothetical protein
MRDSNPLLTAGQSHTGIGLNQKPFRCLPFRHDQAANGYRGNVRSVAEQFGCALSRTACSETTEARSHAPKSADHGQLSYLSSYAVRVPSEHLALIGFAEQAIDVFGERAGARTQDPVIKSYGRVH